MDIKTRNVDATKTITSRPAYITLTDKKTAEIWTWLNGKKSTKTSPGIPAQKFKNKKGEIIYIDIKKMVLEYIQYINKSIYAKIDSNDLSMVNEDK